MAKFPNARNGVDKVFKSAILEIIAAVAAGIVLALSRFVDRTNIYSDVGIAITMGILSVFCVAAAIVAFIVQLIGLNQAGKDNDSFKGAFIFTIVALIAIFVGSILSAIPNLLVANMSESVVTIFSDVLEIVIMILVLNGTTTLFRAQGKEELATRGNTICWLAIAAFALSILFKNLVFVSNFSTISVIFVIVGFVLEIVSYIMYLVQLNKARKSF